MMKTNWQTLSFEKCLEKIKHPNKVQRKAFLKEGKYPIVSQEQEYINGYWNNDKDLFQISKPIIIFGDHTQILKYIDFDFVLGADGARILQPIDKLNSKFFYYTLQNLRIKKLGYARHFRLLKEKLIPIPPLATQKEIVKILDEVFESISKSKENIDKNLKCAKELFESYLEEIFSNPKEDWEEKKLGEVCEFIRGPFGGSLKKSFFKKEGYAVYEQRHAIYNQFDNIRYFVDEKKFNEMKRFELFPSDLIMSCSGTMGKIAIAPKDIKKGIINQALLKLSPSNKLYNIFLKLWMESSDFQKKIKEYSLGAAIQNVASVKILKNIKVKFPTIEEQKAIVQKLDNLSEEIKELEQIYNQKLKDLEELKKSVLQKAFSGELTNK